MTKQHPITPPPEVVDRLFMIEGSEEDRIIAAYRAGTDQELEACVKWVSEYCPYFGDYPLPEDKLRADRRPKPPSLKEQALEALEHILHNSSTELGAETIRRALEALDD
jgi:hypothetical protein